MAATRAEQKARKGREGSLGLGAAAETVGGGRFGCHTQQVMFACTEDWDRFRYSVKNRHRYVLGPSLLGGDTCDGLLSHEHFLEWLLYFPKERNRFVKLDKGTVLWRAQLDGTVQKPPPITVGKGEWGMRAILTPHGRDRMTPYSDKAKEGRINPT